MKTEPTQWVRRNPPPPPDNPSGYLTQTDTWATRLYRIHQVTKGEYEEVDTISIWQFDAWYRGEIDKFIFEIMDSNDDYEKEDNKDYTLSFEMHPDRDSYVVFCKVLGFREDTGFPFKHEMTERFNLDGIEEMCFKKDIPRLQFFTDQFEDFIG